MVFGRRNKKDSGPVPSVPPSDAVSPTSASEVQAEPLDLSIEITPDVDDAHRTVLTEDTRIVGVVQTASALVLQGEVEGEITSTGTIRIAGEGTVKGNVSAHSVDVCGRIDGDVRARHMHVDRTGRVLGSVSVDALVVDEGGVLEGRCTMKRS